jgi:hypothetical protein
MSVSADAPTVQHDHQRAQRSFLEAAAAQVVLDYLNAGPRRAGVTLKTLCFNVLPANRSLLLRSLEALARRGVIQLRPSCGDILVRLSLEVRQ